MKAPYSWIKEYTDVRMDPKKLAHLLTMAGVTVEYVDNMGDDYIFELEVTANRPDCLNIIGIAREVATLLGKKLKVPKELTKSRYLASGAKPALDVILADPELCPHYTARIIRDVEVESSPDWLKKRIISVGLRPVNNIVDITNFVLFETGQPMHAFDLDKIKGNLTVRKAKTGEKIMMIDNIPRTCDEDTLVIADEAGPIAIAGVMGGLETEVNNMTKNILLESAFFNPISIRRTSRRLGLGSESSYRFERKIDNEMVLRASERAGSLIEKIAGGKIGALVDTGDKKGYSKKINFNLEKSNSLLGTSVSKAEAVGILKALGFSVKENRKALKVTVPGFRADVKNETDLTEEIARIYGYDNIPLTVPRNIGHARIKDFASLVQENIRGLLIRFGLNEVITYSLIGRNKIEGLEICEDDIIAIENPLSIDQEIIRPAMLPGMLGVVSYNINRRAKGLSLFEIGKIYKEKKNAYVEELILSVCLSGVKRDDWKVRREEFDFFDIKGILTTLLEGLGLGEAVFKRYKTPGISEDIGSVVEFGGKIIGFLGEVDKKICNRFLDTEKKVFYGEVYIGRLLDKISLERRYVALGRYPSIVRDISVILDKDVTSHDITDIMKEIGGDLVDGILLVDCYKGKQIPEGKKGFLYRVEYRSNERTLEDAEIEKLHSRIKEALAERLKVLFR
ncbi:MAG: phenylalanine--tRNA ligase subunit beta [Omnitrophica bacterium RBG_13_46_9]|nr:MAG: phenylalanine--tRNA ligase subunit beta [Omnitrophica bacterium RBG_13_46_9]